MFWVLQFIMGILAGVYVGEACRLAYENVKVRQAVELVKDRKRSFLRGYAAGVYAERSRNVS